MKKTEFLKMLMVSAVISAGLILIGCSGSEDGTNSSGGEPSPLAGKLLILQAYGNGPMTDGSPNGASHSFIELYNTTNQTINLNGISLYYANGIRGTDVTKDEDWKKISLNGKTIPANGSFLILGAKHGNISSTRYKIEDGYGDINDNNLILSRRSFKIALIDGSTVLTAQNPFNIDGEWTKATGYIDMVGAVNNSTAAEPDNIFGFEVSPARNSASAAIRRESLTDTNDNSSDFIQMRYASDGINNQMLEVRKPRNSTDTASGWDPFAEPEIPPAATGLMILQVGAATDGAITCSFVELYNNSAAPVNLSAFSLQLANGTDANNNITVVSDWIVISLTGTIPAYGSYLVKGSMGTAHSSNRLYIDVADQTEVFVISNRSYKAALMSNKTKLAVANPFDENTAGYIDMIGAINEAPRDGIDAYEGALLTGITKHIAARRNFMSDTDDNSADFATIDYRTAGTTNDQLALYRPRYSGDGAWNPVTGAKLD